jgi:hypothetical protein
MPNITTSGMRKKKYMFKSGVSIPNVPTFIYSRVNLFFVSIPSVFQQLTA